MSNASGFMFSFILLCILSFSNLCKCEDDITDSVLGKRAQRDTDIGYCGGNYTYESDSLASPGYPSNYGNNEHCIYYITVDSGYQILLQFTSFSLETSSDILQVFDIDNSTSSRIGVFTGGSIPSDIISTSNELRLVFQSDSAITYPGFYAKYTKYTSELQVPTSTYSQSSVTTESGDISGTSIAAVIGITVFLLVLLCIAVGIICCCCCCCSCCCNCKNQSAAALATSSFGGNKAVMPQPNTTSSSMPSQPKPNLWATPSDDQIQGLQQPRAPPTLNPLRTSGQPKPSGNPDVQPTPLEVKPMTTDSNDSKLCRGEKLETTLIDSNRYEFEGNPDIHPPPPEIAMLQSP